MKLADLKTFIDIVDAGSVTQAARRRGLSQPGLSRTLRELEHRLKTTLLHRDGRGVALTPSGEMFLAFAQQTLNRLQEVEAGIAEFGEGLPDKVKLFVPMRTEHVFLRPIHQAFADQLPTVSLQMEEAYTEAGLVEIGERRVDAMIGFGKPRDTPGDRPIAQEEFYAVGTSDALGHSDDVITMREVLALPLLVAGPPRYMSMLERAAEACGGTLRPARVCFAADAMVAFAAEGEGVALLPYSNFQRETARGEVVFRKIIDPVIQRDVFLNLRTGLSLFATRAIRAAVLSGISQAEEKTRWF